MAIDCDVVTYGIQSECDVPANAGSTAVDLVLLNHQPDQSLGALNFNLFHNGQAQLPAQPRTCIAPGTDCNPDLNEEEFGGAGWQCWPVHADDDWRPEGVDSFASCFNGRGDGWLSSTGMTRIARMTYDVSGTLGEVTMSVRVVNVADQLGVELLGCHPGLSPCHGATVRVVDPVENPPTPLPTATPTADVPMPPVLAPIAALDAASTPASGMHLALDCAVDIPGLQDRCTYESGSAHEIRVGVVAIAPQWHPGRRATGRFWWARVERCHRKLVPVVGNATYYDSNPDLNDEAVSRSLLRNVVRRLTLGSAATELRLSSRPKGPRDSLLDRRLARADLATHCTLHRVRLSTTP